MVIFQRDRVGFGEAAQFTESGLEMAWRLTWLRRLDRTQTHRMSKILFSYIRLFKHVLFDDWHEHVQQEFLFPCLLLSLQEGEADVYTYSKELVLIRASHMCELKIRTILDLLLCIDDTGVRHEILLWNTIMIDDMCMWYIYYNLI